eukprot:7773887-Lingulodinium_polyedra.AAC.1
MSGVAWYLAVLRDAARHRMALHNVQQCCAMFAQSARNAVMALTESCMRDTLQTEMHARCVLWVMYHW